MMLDDANLQKRFLRSYAKHGVPGPALRDNGLERFQLDTWLEDEGFQVQYAAALEEAIDLAEMELRRRAVEGSVRILFHMGTPIWKRDPSTGETLLDDNFEPIAYTENERSDSLLALYMKANRAKYRDNGKSSVELAAPGGGPLMIVTQYVLPDGKTEADYDAAAAHLRSTKTG